MKIESIKLVCFSPTRTTRKILDGIAQGIGVEPVDLVDLTRLSSGTPKHLEMRNELTLIGSPVYAGRLPADAVSRLKILKGNGAPAVIVVLYGNRAYEDALIELRDLAVELGFRPVAAGAFIGEHSYSNSATPVAVGRPDAQDMERAREFGGVIRKKLEEIRGADDISPLKVPGNFPYKELRMLSGIVPITQESICSKCGMCATVCPTAAITLEKTVVSDADLCIRCCACIKNCPTGARIMEDARIRQLGEWLTTNCSDRKEPEIFY